MGEPEMCENSRNENACGVCLACVTVGRDHALRQRAEAIAEADALRAKVADLERAYERANKALAKISDIRDSIIGAQTVNWSEHIYPLVAALKEAGFEGVPYEEARAHVGTLIEQVKKLEAFKAYVHQRLDAAGIPTHPDGPHSKEGCRIGDRLDMLINQRASLATGVIDGTKLHLDALARAEAAERRVAELEREIEAVLSSLGPRAVRIREGGGPESLCASLAVSVAALSARPEAAPAKSVTDELKRTRETLEGMPGEVGRKARAMLDDAIAGREMTPEERAAVRKVRAKGVQKELSLADAIRIVRETPNAPGTHTGARQAWLREAIVARLEGRPVPEFVEAPTTNLGVGSSSLAVQPAAPEPTKHRINCRVFDDGLKCTCRAPPSGGETP